MWELGCEESWALKNWCFWTVVLEKTLESPLDCKEIQLVHSEGDQPWDFFGRNDAEAETPVLWPPYVKSWLIGKDSDSGRDWGQEEKGTTEDEMAGWHHWLDACESEWTLGVGDGLGGLVCRDSRGRRVGHDWAAELTGWTDTTGSFVSRRACRCQHTGSKVLTSASLDMNLVTWQQGFHFSHSATFVLWLLTNAKCSLTHILIMQNPLKQQKKWWPDNWTAHGFELDTLQILFAIEFLQFKEQSCGFPEILLGRLFTLLRDQEPRKGKWGAEGLTTVVVKSWSYLGEGMCSGWPFLLPWLVCNGQLVGGNDGWVGGGNAGWNA